MNELSFGLLSSDVDYLTKQRPDLEALPDDALAQELLADFKDNDCAKETACGTNTVGYNSRNEDFSDNVTKLSTVTTTAVFDTAQNSDQFVHVPPENFPDGLTPIALIQEQQMVGSHYVTNVTQTPPTVSSTMNQLSNLKIVSMEDLSNSAGMFHLNPTAVTLGSYNAGVDVQHLPLNVVTNTSTAPVYVVAMMVEDIPEEETLCQKKETAGKNEMVKKEDSEEVS